MLVGCISILILNMTVYPINANDISVFTRAQEVCKQKPYGGCITKLIKQGERDYQVKCGDKQQLHKILRK